MTAILTGDTTPRHRLPSRPASAPVFDDPLTGLPGFGPAPLVTLVWDDGTRCDVHAPTVVGRNPGAVPGWRTAAVRDETLSLSRSHLAVGGHDGAVWVADTGSTNGTEIVRDGERHRIAPGERWIVRAGDILEVGDRRVNIEGA